MYPPSSWPWAFVVLVTLFALSRRRPPSVHYETLPFLDQVLLLRPLQRLDLEDCLYVAVHLWVSPHLQHSKALRYLVILN